jgi:hypothetical protein
VRAGVQSGAEREGGLKESEYLDKRFSHSSTKNYMLNLIFLVKLYNSLKTRLYITQKMKAGIGSCFIC